MTSDWNTLLDEIEQDLAAVEAALADRARPPEPLARSVPASSLPAELAPRAEALLARTRGLEARTEADKERIGTNLLTLAGRHQAPEQARTGRFVDLAG
jgi:hypothetical protein